MNALTVVLSVVATNFVVRCLYTLVKIGAAKLFLHRIPDYNSKASKEIEIP